MKIFVTGCAGLLGSNYSRHLIANGHEVIGIDNLNNYYDKSLKEACFTSAGGSLFQTCESVGNLPRRTEKFRVRDLKRLRYDNIDGNFTSVKIIPLRGDYPAQMSCFSSYIPKVVISYRFSYLERRFQRRSYSKILT